MSLFSEAECSSKELYQAYRRWCDDNTVYPLSARSFVNWLIENQNQWGLRYTNGIYLSGGRRVRGFVGIEPVV